MTELPAARPMLIDRVDTRGHLKQSFEIDPNLVLYEEIGRLYGPERQQRFLEYRQLFEYSKRTRTVAPYPLNVNLAPIDACQLKCPHCYRQHNPDHYIKKRLTWDEIKKIIDECAEIGVPSMFFGSGSELFLHKQGIEMLEYAAEKGILDIFTCTNGVLMTPEITDRLLAARITRLNVSIDAATAETYSKVRGEGFETLCDNLDYLIRRKQELGLRLPILRISFVNYNLNTHERDAFVERWQGKADIVDVQMPMDIRLVDTLPFEHLDEMNCTYPWEMMMVNWDGEIFPCCLEFGKHVAVGNIASLTMAQAWNSEKMRTLRESFVSNCGVPRACVNCIKSTNPEVTYDPIQPK